MRRRPSFSLQPRRRTRSTHGEPRGSADLIAADCALCRATRVERARPRRAADGSDAQRAQHPCCYTFDLQSSCTPERVEAVGLEPGHALARAVAPGAARAAAARCPSSRSHPRACPRSRRARSRRTRGAARTGARAGRARPGHGEIEATRVFGDAQQVTVAPGTQLLHGEGASLIFLGAGATSQARARADPIERAGTRRGAASCCRGRRTRGLALRSRDGARFGSTPAWRFQPLSRDDRSARHRGHRDARTAVHRQQRLATTCVHAAYVGTCRSRTAARPLAPRRLDLEFTGAVLRGSRSARPATTRST